MRSSLSALSLLVLCASCIPSHRMVHMGDRYFEQCYGADFEARVPAHQKEACWQAWIAHYTRHQPAHRIDYAMQRVEALQQGDTLPALPGLPNAQFAAATADSQVALESTMPRDPAIPAEATDKRTEIPNGCIETCNHFESQCVGGCPPDSTNCRVGCTRERAICLGGCH